MAAMRSQSSPLATVCNWHFSTIEVNLLGGCRLRRRVAAGDLWRPVGRVRCVRVFTQEEWDSLIAEYPFGTPVTGEVVSCQLYGVFVRLDQLPDVTALLEIVHFGLLVDAPKHHIQFPADYPTVGTRINARILAWSQNPKDVRLTQLEHLNWTSGTDGASNSPG